MVVGGAVGGGGTAVVVTVVGGAVVVVAVVVGAVVGRSAVVLVGVSPSFGEAPSSDPSRTSRAGVVFVGKPNHSTAPTMATTAATAAAMRALRWDTAATLVPRGEGNRRGG